MNIQFGCSLSNTVGRDRADEMCCLHALGELSAEEGRRMEDHLCTCDRCRALMAEYRQIMFFDLPAIAVTQSQDSIVESPSSLDEGRLLASIRERATAVRQRHRDMPSPDRFALSISTAARQLFTGRIIAFAGWATAAALVLATGRASHVRPPQVRAGGTPQTAYQVNDFTAMQSQFAAAERRTKELQSQLLQARNQIKASESAFTRSTTQSQDLTALNSALQAQTQEQESKLTQQGAELELTRQRLKDEVAEGDTLRGKLTDVYDRLDKEKVETAKLQRIAASTTTHFPVYDQPLGESEAKEILGARDLHIVDVYDVDGSGKSSRSYGRIYFVNRNQLIFYAFDLSKLESGHKVVAFQAWGFRQPQSSSVESLGLFYLDNATLNRWTLRISDPQVLSRIDSLFVTVEPPGGSPVPKGRRLLMASLAGPPNHP